MYLGSLVEEAPSDALYAGPKHPYTKALMSAVPVPDPEVEDRRERILLQGDLPSPANPPTGCRFHTRCPWAQDKCAVERPVLTDVGDGHKVACHFTAEIEAGTIGMTRETGIEAVTRTEEVAAEGPDEPKAEVPAQASGEDASATASVAGSDEDKAEAGETAQAAASDEDKVEAEVDEPAADGDAPQSDASVKESSTTA
jgi:peptide/nickel transport system ATP-binding protein